MLRLLLYRIPILLGFIASIWSCSKRIDIRKGTSSTAKISEDSSLTKTSAYVTSKTKTSTNTSISSATPSSTQTATNQNTNTNTNTGINQTIKLSLGKYQSFMTTKDNTTQQIRNSAWGLNSIGQLGLGNTIDTNLAAPLANTFTEIATKSYHSCAMAIDNSVYCWGSNNYGQSGQSNTSTDLLTPVKIPNLIAKQITVGAEHSCIISSPTSEVFCWGLNSDGQIGNEQNDIDSKTPFKIPGLIAQTISSGYFHNCALLLDQSIQCWGANSNGQLGKGTSSYFSGTPTAISSTLKFKNLSAGFAHTCAISSADELYCWGYNKYGQLGSGSTNNANTPQRVLGLSKVLAVSAGFGHTCAILADNSISCWGHNQFGQLGIDQNANDIKTPSPVPNFKAASIYTGEFHTCAVQLDNKVFCWGANKFGQLGLGHNSPSKIPVEMTGLTTNSSIASTFNESYDWSINDFDVERKFFDKKLVVNGVTMVGSRTIENETMTTLSKLLKIMTRNMPSQYLSQLAGGKIGIISEYDLPSKFEYLGEPMNPDFRAWLKSTIDHGWRGYGGANFALIGEELTCHYGIPTRTTNDDTLYRRLDHLAHEYGHQMAGRFNSPPLNFDLVKQIGTLTNDSSMNGEWPAWDSQFFFSQQSWSNYTTGTASDLDPKVRNLYISIYGPVPSATELDLCPKH